MTTTSAFDAWLERVEAGDRLTAGEVADLVALPDILQIGMLADAERRRTHGTRVTYLRVAACPYDQSFTSAVPPAAREVRVTGVPDSLAVAVSAVEHARAVAGDRVVAGFDWPTIEALAAAGGGAGRVLAALREAGLDALAALPLDSTADVGGAIERLRAAGFDKVRLTVDRAPAAERLALFAQASALQRQLGGIQSINPLPAATGAARPTTGYDDVKMVAAARLAAPEIPSVQVDWLRYGPKLAQVALTFGADDLDGVTGSDDAPEGRRRAPIEDVRRNVEAAGFVAVERDGRFAVLA